MPDILPRELLFIDIETIPQHENYQALPETEKKLWGKKAQFLIKSEDSVEDIYQRAGIYAEFGKIICISTGYLVEKNKAYQLNLKSFYGHEEATLLTSFKDYLVNEMIPKKITALCAHNGKEFDYPYIIRRMLINGISLPAILNLSGKKPWEILHQDTLDLWKFGDYKHYTSLELLAYIFGVNSPKDDIDGSMVAEVYYKEKNLKRIVEYCNKDVITLAQLYLKMKGDLGFDDKEVNYLP
ncbi:MAG: 3'-5' exonuclease [Bacteroidia bacterium]|nr:3'-5' exonuclease [Bacteroidia bacterium]